ncbi:hypothetical protein C8J57DRAFT_1674670 [Mycena rebaudengoi]|nr:hypothetical protein C8J57DRAFT_1674670 [Mycena rebaudengoi]
MISLLFLVHTLSGYHFGPQATLTESCDDINNCRKLFDIVWGCLATIFACTWVSVHPNVPPPNMSPLTLLWYRLRMMLIAIIAPELMVGFAARQFFTSRWYAKEHKISKTHGFFISMGGFVSHVGHHPITNPSDVHEYLAAIRAVDVGDINDKSKGDALSKGVAFAQGAWFMTQCFARVAQNLPITELEIATLAFAVVNVFIWLLWWNKPLDVQRPIMVIPLNDRHLMSPLGYSEEASGRRRIMFGLINVMVNGHDTYDPAVDTSVPPFWSSSDKQDKYKHAFLMGCLVGTMFGSIHCAAWNADFASSVEMWLWRSCALSVTAIPLIIALRLAAFITRHDEDDSFPVILKILFWLFVLSLVTYVIARLFLIVLPLIALRAPAAGSLMDVNWSIYIPHL